MVEIKQVPSIDCEDIEELIGVRWNKCEFAQMAENGSYVAFNLDDESYFDYEDSMDYTLKHRPKDEYERHLNNYKLATVLRGMGYNDIILIGVCW